MLYLQSGLVTGPVVVAIRPQLSTGGVELILGNDLAGGRAFPAPIVVDRPTGSVVEHYQSADLSSRLPSLSCLYCDSYPVKKV